MATINLLPPEQKRGRQIKTQRKDNFQFSPDLPLRPNRAFMIFAGISCLIFISWAGLFIQSKVRERLLDSFAKKLIIRAEKLRRINELSEKKYELSQMISLYQKISGSRITWTEKLFSIMNILPPQIWLTNIYTAEVKPDKILTIKGCSSSLMETEILNSISQFTSALKESAPLKETFQDFKLGELNAEKRGNLTVMIFSLSCKSKTVLRK